MVHRFGVFYFDDDGKERARTACPAAIERQPAKARHAAGVACRTSSSRAKSRAKRSGQDMHVDFDRGLAYCVSQIRTALGDSGDNPRFVQTIPKQGFKFIAPVTTTVLARRRFRQSRSDRRPFLWRSALASPSSSLARRMAWLG